MLAARLCHTLNRVTMVMAPRRAMSSKVQNYTYNVPLRAPTMNDTMEPYGSWKVAYAAEKKLANQMLAKGILALTASLIFFFNCGATDGMLMPNLDNIMEDTEPYHEGFDFEGRVTVKP